MDTATMTNLTHSESQSAPTSVIVYGTAWCPDCHRTRRFLDQHHVPYTWIDPDRDDQAMRRLVEINHGMRSVPTLIFPDGTTLTEPSNGQLARKLGL
jgi:glutaredoxin